MQSPARESEKNSSPSADFTIAGQWLIDDIVDGQSTEEDGIWDEKPVSIDEFLYGEKYLNLGITLSDPQVDLIDNLSDIFAERPMTEGVLMAGQGSGKDTCSIFIGLRIVYLLHCLKSPQTYLGMDTSGFIDTINVAPNADLARNIFFQTLTNVLRNSPLFTDEVAEPGMIKYSSTQTVLNFPKNIRLISGNSENEAWQGYTPILIVLDEIDAFKSEQELQRSRSLRSEGAEGVYKTAKALIQSRFPGVGKVISLSWPRFRGSFIQRRFDAGKLEARTYVACKEDGEPYATWEFNPSKKKEDFEDFYINDPVLARARFECDPPYARDAFIREPLPVLRAFDADVDEAGEIVHAGIKEIRDEYMMEKGKYYYIHVDLGLRHSDAALCIAHQEGDSVYLDAIKVWVPEPEKDVDFRSIERFIMNLREQGHRIASVTYDNYQSVNSLQTLQSAGIPAKYKSIGRGREAYDTLKDLIYQEKLDGFYHKETIDEILGLDVVYGERIDARPGMKKDMADAVAGAVHGVLKEKGIVTRMGNVGNLNTLFSSPTTTVDADPRYKNPAVESLNDTSTSFRQADIAKRIVSSSRDVCDTCNRLGGIEYSDEAGGRTFDPILAMTRQCIICGTRWTRSDFDGVSWELKREPDSYLMSQLGFDV